MLTKRTANPGLIWNYLNGVVNIYKPAGISVAQVRKTVITNLCRDLNELNRSNRDVARNSALSLKSSSGLVNINLPSSLAPFSESTDFKSLIVGERYQNEDFKSSSASHLGKFTSGVLVLGLNRGVKQCHKIRENRSIRVYHVTGRMGRSTETHFRDSPVTARATYSHVYPEKVSSLLSSMQASHQKKMFELCSVDLQSQAAYELAVKGLIRPAVSNIPLLYGIKCIDSKRPDFTIEVHATNESEAYLGILIHEIGLHLKTVAHCTQLRCIRNSYFTLEDSLVRPFWNLQSILSSLSKCNQIIKNHPEILHQEIPELSQSQNLVQ